MEPLRMGVLGAARISRSAIVDAARLTGVRLVAVAARDPVRAEAFAAEHRVERVLTSYAELLTDPEIEAIYNPLANGLHGPWNLASIVAGKHVLSEKPFASNAEEAAEVCEAGRRAGLVVAEAFHYRYHPIALRVLDVLASGELGDLQRVEMRTTMPAPPEHDARWSFALAGGSMMDLGCYGVHALRSMAPILGGEPSLLRARGGERAGAAGVDEWLEAEFVYPSGVAAFTHCDMAATVNEWTWRVIGSAGEVLATSFVPVVIDDRVIVRTGGGERVEHLGKRPSYAYQLEAFAAAVRKGVPMLTAGDDPVATMRLIDQCYLAAGFPLRPRLPRLI